MKTFIKFFSVLSVFLFFSCSKPDTRLDGTWNHTAKYKSELSSTMDGSESGEYFIFSEKTISLTIKSSGTFEKKVTQSVYKIEDNEGNLVDSSAYPQNSYTIKGSCKFKKENEKEYLDTFSETVIIDNEEFEFSEIKEQFAGNEYPSERHEYVFIDDNNMKMYDYVTDGLIKYTK